MKPVPTDRRPGSPVPVSVRTGIRVLAGLFFLATGVAKLPVIGEVADVLIAGFGAGETLAWSGAVAVTGIEIGVGVLLLTGILARTAAGAAALCMAAFAAATLSLIMRGVDLDCHCFGILGQLPLAGEAALDCLLAPLLLILRRSLPPEEGVRGPLRAVPIGVAALLLTTMVALTRGSGDSAAEGSEIARRFGWGDGGPPPRLLLLVDLREFHCSICFDDFLALCDSIRRLPSGWEGALTILRNDSGAGTTEPSLRHWAKETGIGGRLFVLDGETYDGIHPGGNAALILRPDGGTELRTDLPLGMKGRDRLLALLTEK